MLSKTPHGTIRSDQKAQHHFLICISLKTVNASDRTEEEEERGKKENLKKCLYFCNFHTQSPFPKPLLFSLFILFPPQSRVFSLSAAPNPTLFLSGKNEKRGVEKKLKYPHESLSIIFHHKVSILNAELRYSCRFIPTQKNVRGRRGTVCYYTSFRPETLQWVCAVSSA